jgi:hypothetical protein
VHHVGSSLHDYIEMHGQQNVKSKVSPISKHRTVKVYMRHKGTATVIHKLRNRYKCIVNFMLWLLPPRRYDGTHGKGLGRSKVRLERMMKRNSF